MPLKNLQKNKQSQSYDSLYQTFFKNVAGTPTGKFENVQHWIELDSISYAANANYAITTTNTLEADQKTVNSIYLNSWAVGELAFGSADSATLLTIANKDPLLDGSAVYTAQVMLNITSTSSGSRMRSNTNNPPATNNAVRNLFSKIYPNPNDGTMQLSYQLQNGQKGEVIIYDMYGKKVSSYALDAFSQGYEAQSMETKILKISEEQLTNGIYLYEIKVNGELIESDKIIIIK